jgi:hypothetical protein
VATPNIDQMLQQSGAVLVRANKHEVYRLPNGKKFTKSSTPSDHRAALNQAADLRRLIGDRQQPVRPPVDATPTPIVVQVKEQAPPRLSVKSSVRTIAAELAAQWLAERNYGNRRLNENTYSKYARDMACGRWELNGEPIIFSDAGRLIDGQHRLKGIVVANVPVQVLVIEGIPDKAFSTINTGKGRSLSDVLTIGGHKHSALLSAALQWVMRLETRNLVNVKTQAKFSFTQAECKDALADHPDLEKSVSFIGNSSTAVKKIASPGLTAALHYLFGKRDETMAAAFFDALGTGTGLHEDEAVYLLRERLIANRASAAKLPIVTMAALFVKAWNATVSGAKVRRLSWKATTEDFPQIADTMGG